MGRIGSSFAAWFPVQAGIAQSMARTVLARPGRPLVSLAQLEALIPRLEPGDILLVRREWYLQASLIPRSRDLRTGPNHRHAPPQP